MITRLIAMLITLLCWCQITSAAELDLPAAYQPQQQVSGTIRIWGHGAYAGRQDFIESLVKVWEEAFRKYQPNVQFDNHLNGTAAAIGSLYTGTGDLALMGREIWPNEISAFTEVFHYPPTGVDVVTGSFNVRNRGYALVVFVHKDNPLRQLTLQQLSAIFGDGQRTGLTPITTWGELGLSGEWRDRPIHLYGLPIARGFAEYFEEAVFNGGRKWNPALREFADQPGSKGGATDGGQIMLDAMANDPAAIGYAGLLYHNANTVPVALAVRNGAPFVMPTKATVLDHSYPLTRMITIYLHRVPGKPAEQRLREFLRFVLSREGQQLVLREGQGYLPIMRPSAERELRKLD